MKAIILAAGRGSRLGKITKHKPKGMVLLNGRKLIDYQIQALNGAGIRDVAVVTGYLKNMISHPCITKYFENKIWFKTNMVFSMFEASEWLENFSCIISYSDIFYTDDAVQKLIDSTDDISITYDKNFAQLWQKRFENPLNDLESFKIDMNHYLIEIGQKVSDIEQIEGQYMGLTKITPSGWNAIKKIMQNQQTENIDMTTMFNLIIQQGIKIRAIPISDNWGEIDNASDLELYENNR